MSSIVGVSTLIFFIINLYPMLLLANDHFDADAEVVTVKSPKEILSKQNLKQFVGISAKNAGTNVLSMNRVIIPPGAQAKAHYHDGFESTVYVIQGRVEMRYGKNLEKIVINEAGDFIYIPPNVPHQPRNLSNTEPAIAIVSRNDPSEQESVVHYDETDD